MLFFNNQFSHDCGVALQLSQGFGALFMSCTGPPGTVAAVALVWAAAVSGIAGCGNQDSLAARLNAAQAGWRATEGRLDGLAHAPYAAGEAVVARMSALAEVRRWLAGARRSHGRATGPQEAAATATLALLGGSSATAVSRLTAALASAPPALAPALSNELAVAYLEHSRAGTEPLDPVLALEACSRALDAAPGMLAARFNRALALERLAMPTAAAAAWTDYLQRDPKSAWAAEARGRRGLLLAQQATARDACAAAEWNDPALPDRPALVDRLVGRCPDGARIHVEDELLPRWADEIAGGRPATAARHLELMRQVGWALAQRGLDLMVADVVSAADTTASGSSHAALVRGLQRYSNGQARSRDRQPGAAALAFAGAAADLAATRSPFAGWAAFQHAVSLCYVNRYGAAARELRQLFRRLPDRYPVLRGRVERMLGLICIIEANPGEAVAHYQEGLAASERGRDLEGLATLHAHIAESISFIGDARAAWKHRRAALALAASLPDSTKVQTVLDEVAEAALRQGCPHAARLLQDQALAIAVRLGDELAIYAAYRQLIPIDRRLEDWPAVAEDRAKAIACARRISDPDLQRRLEGELETVYGDTVIDRQPADAARAYARALAVWSAIGYRYAVVGLFAAHARACEHSGDLVSAGEDLKAGLVEIDRRRRELTTPEQRRRLLEQARQLFDAAVSLFGQRLGDKAAAYHFAELGRSRSLLEAVAGGAQIDRPGPSRSAQPSPSTANSHPTAAPAALRPLTLDETRRLLPEGEVLLEYAVVQGHVLRWTIDRESASLSQISLAGDQLEREVQSLRLALERPPPGWTGAAPAAARELYRQLIPAQLAAGGAQRLVIVPDRELNALPFSALADPRSGRYLVEQMPVVVAPSATFYLRGEHELTAAASRHGAAAPSRSLALSALVIGDPELAPFLRDRFPPLPGARQEAQQVASVYAHHRLLLGGAATKRDFLDGASAFDVIHIAGHAGSAGDEPLLLLSGNGLDPGLLAGTEIERLPLRRTRLVVLAACGSASGSLLAAEGPMSAARAFLAAGAPTVIASLFDLVDQAGPALFVALHRRIATGSEAAAALRAVQLEAIAAMRTAPPEQRFAWASLQVVGGQAHEPPRAGRARREKPGAVRLQWLKGEFDAE